MPLPERRTSSFVGGLDLPSRLFGSESTDYELYEADEEFVLSVELPGFDGDDLAVTWDDGVLNVAAERDDDRRGGRRTYHRRFRFPRDVDEDAITAEYTNGVLEVRLPMESSMDVSGTRIEIDS